MNPADRVIEKFGGQSTLARFLGKGPSTVQYWSRSGVIPAKWRDIILKLAQERSIDLSLLDFIDDESAEVIPGGQLPEAKWPGTLPIGDAELPVYVLDNGRRVISRTGAVAALIGPQGGGNLESYLRTQALSGFVSPDLSKELIAFSIPGVVNKSVQGMTAEGFLDICRAFGRARDAGALTTPRQEEIAIKAGMFLSACADVGLTALIDEVTGYQYERAQDALQVKLRLYLEEEMRKWEKTFPDDLWKEFGRLTRWQGALHERPKYWGKLVMELVYGYLDPDVTKWLKENAPKPQHGQNYHQWLSTQYGLRRLIEHIWMVIGMASACSSLPELKRKMAEKYGREPVQIMMYLPPPSMDTPMSVKRGRVLPGQAKLLPDSNEGVPVT